jgi:hypothetical protein
MKQLITMLGMNPRTQHLTTETRTGKNSEVVVVVVVVVVVGREGGG